MNAVVDDLTNYLGPDPNATGDGGNTKVYQFTAGQTWTLSPTLLMDSTFGFSRQKQDVLGPDFNAGNFGLDMLGIPGTNDQGIGDQRYAGLSRIPVRRDDRGFFSQLGNRDGWNPIFRDERTYSIAHEHHQGEGPARFPRRLLPELPLPRSLAAGNRQPARPVRLQLPNTTGLRGGARRANFYNAYASFLLGLVGSANKSVQNELMTAREWQHALYFRDRWTPNAEADAGSRPAVGALPDHAPRRRPRPRSARSRNPDFARQLDVIVAGRGGNPQTNGMEAGLNNFAPRVGGVYRINDNDGLPHRLRPDLQRAGRGRAPCAATTTTR